MLSHFSGVWLCDPMDYRLPGSFVHGILQARIPEWVAMPSSRGSSQPRVRTQHLLHLPVLAGRFFTTGTTWEALSSVWDSTNGNSLLWGLLPVGWSPVKFVSCSKSVPAQFCFPCPHNYWSTVWKFSLLTSASSLLAFHRPRLWQPSWGLWRKTFPIRRGLSYIGQR